MNEYYILDVETKSLPREILTSIIPDFKPAGNLKDPDKIAADLQKKSDDWFESAALDAHRGEIIAIGLKRGQGIMPLMFHGQPEAEMLRDLRSFATAESDSIVVGHYILGFDIPYLCRRMWRHGIQPPRQWLDCTAWKAHWAFDTAQVWTCGNREQKISLDNLAWHLGYGRKTGNGADFAKLYETDREAALDYLRNDLKLTEQCYLKMRNNS